MPPALLPGGGEVKWLGREPDYSPRASAEEKNEWSYTSASPHTICLHECIEATFFLRRFVCILLLFYFSVLNVGGLEL